jgi:hypothetical protein
MGKNTRIDLRDRKVWTGCIWLRTGDQWWAVVKTVMNLGVP